MGLSNVSSGRRAALIPAVVMAVIATCTPARDSKYTCIDEGFTICFPKEWKVVEHSRGTRILAEIPDHGQETFINQNVNVVVDIPRSSVDLMNYVESQINALGKLRGIEFSERSEETVGGAPARRFTYGYAINDFGYRAVVYVAKHEEKFYVITGISQRENYSTLEPRFHEIAKSVRFE
jgi:predicted Zn-dependent protease with MMP-like domain